MSILPPFMKIFTFDHEVLKLIYTPGSAIDFKFKVEEHLPVTITCEF